MNIDQLLIEAKDKGVHVTSYAKHGGYEAVFLQGAIVPTVKTMEVLINDGFTMKTINSLLIQHQQTLMIFLERGM